jgi:alpha-galactosidase
LQLNNFPGVARKFTRIKIMTSINCKLAATAVFSAAFFAHAATVRLDELDLTAMTAGWGKPQPNFSITQKPLAISGAKFEHGVGTHAESDVTVQLDGKAKWFTAKVGVDDHASNAQASVEFIVSGDDRELWRSGVCKWGEPPRECRVKLDGIKSLELEVTDSDDGINYDHADWANAAFEFNGAVPQTVKNVAPAEDAVILTPPAPREPRINGPKVYGLRPGSPFLYRIPCTGERPIHFSAKNLPPGLTLDSQSGIISGKISTTSMNRVTLVAQNTFGEGQREFCIVVGNTLALTPPMGWNSWYIHYNRVTEATMRDAADQMIASGMADFGYQYVNIDDCWMKKKGDVPYRDTNGAVLPNWNFPDMKGLADYIHAKGLKAGLYTSPGPWTCGGYVGAYQHEATDARKFAEWGFDFLKYDWCSYGGVAGGSDLAHLKKPYQLMWDELQKLDRDIVFNLCQYGMGDVWNWGGEVGNSWRTTGDLGLARGSRLPSFYSIGFSNARHWENAKPGAWNDPDYILVGWVGDAHGMGAGKKTTLTPNEQYSYMSLWSLMAAPLIFSGDMAKLDAFTLNVLCNTEVIEVDQDPLGKQAKIQRQTRDEFVLVKELEDGSKAVGLFNLSSRPRRISVAWSDLGVSGNQHVRDLWRQKEIGSFDKTFEIEVLRHGVFLVRLQPEK